MFEQKSDIRPFFEDAGLAPFAPEIERLCAPALTFVATAQGEAAAGQLGGTPLMPASLAWPKHPDYRNGVALAERLGGRGPGIDRLRDSLDDADWEESWDNVFDDIMDVGARQLASGREVLPHRLGGWPIPEQGDPRFAAAAAARDPLGRTPNEAERAACEAEMHAWTLLLQIDLNDMGKIFAEGTLYFVMRDADLKAANFERVHAICQQT